MSWEDRLKDAAYTSPSGERITFLYEDVSRSFDKKTANYEFPDAKGTYVQDNGSTGRKYPFTAYFSGEDCDQQADAFEEALSETGRGKLEHPLYGTVDVVPFGTITRNDNLKTAANQSIVEVTFWETIPLIYPIPQTDPASEVLDDVRGLADAIGVNVADKLDIFSPEAIERFKTTTLVLIGNVQTVIGKATQIKDQVTAKVSEITARIDSIVTATSETADLVRQNIADSMNDIMDLMALPSTVQTSIKSKINDYRDMISNIISPLFPDNSEPDFLSSEAVVESIVGGLIVNVVESEFDTQGSALESAEDLLEVLDEVTTWTENTSEQVGLVDTGESYQRLQEAVAFTAGYLVEISFTLKKERRVVMTRSRSIIDLAAELYGQVDEILDFFITSNDFSGSELLEVPRGREVLYYV